MRSTRPRPSPSAAACPPATIRRLAREMAHVAFHETITLADRWTDAWGHTHDKVVGRPVAMYAMRGVSAHSNGFQTCRALHLIQMLLGALEGPGNFRARAPYPRPMPPPQLPANARSHAGLAARRRAAGLSDPARGPGVDDDGSPLRIDKAYSWESPLAAHGLMHMVIANAVAGDPYPIDTLMLFMANMAWNSAMNTAGTREMLRAKDASGEYRIPFVVVCDAFGSETVAFADLVLPDTTYLERYDAISLLDRPISEPDAAADAIRHPVLRARPRRAAVAGSAGRTGGAARFPAFTRADGTRKFGDYRDFIVRYEKRARHRLPRRLARRGRRRSRSSASRIRTSGKRTSSTSRSSRTPCPMRISGTATRTAATSSSRRTSGFIGDAEPIVMQIWSEPLQKFRLAGQGVYDGPRPTDPRRRERLADVLRSAAVLARAARDARQTDGDAFPLHAITQRPMVMYHSWDSQNAWLRQIIAENALYMNTRHGRGARARRR